MGRRNRQRTSAPSSAGSSAARPAKPTAPPRAPRRHARMEEAPKAPWHPVPLVEIAVLVGIVALVLGFLSEGGRRGTLVTAGVALASLAGLELSIREHFSGFRSHTSLLSLAAALLVGFPAWMLGTPHLVAVGLAVVIGAGAFAGLRAAFVRRSGGLSWRA